jgi:hypothetical protein
VVKLNNDIVRPKFLKYFFTQHHFAGVLYQDQQNLERLFSEPEAGAVFAQLAGAHVKFVRAKPVVPRGRPSCAEQAKRRSRHRNWPSLPQSVAST